jgi:hypothetical protein
MGQLTRDTSLRQAKNKETISGEVSGDSFYSAEHISVLERRIADMKAGKNVHVHELITETE